MKKNLLILLVCAVCLVLGGAFLIFSKEPTMKKYVSEEQDRAYPKLNSKENNNPKVVAKIDGQEVTEEDLLGQDGLVYYEIKQQEFEFKFGRLRRIIIDKFLQSQSQAMGISPEDFVRNHIVKGKILKPSEQEIKLFAQEQNLPNFDQIKSNPQAYAQIEQFIRMKKEFDLVQIEVNKWSQNHNIEYYFPRPALPMTIPEYASPAWGPVKAKVVIFKFSDFECPFCSRAGKTLMKLKQKYQDKIRIVYKHYPLPSHPHAKEAAFTSVCIAQQKPMGFWKFYESMLDKHDKITAALLMAEAKKQKLNMDDFEKCLQDPTTEATVAQDVELAERIGLESTPVFFINGEMIKGAAPMEAFEEIIDYHLKK